MMSLGSIWAWNPRGSLLSSDGWGVDDDGAGFGFGPPGLDDPLALSVPRVGDLRVERRPSFHEPGAACLEAVDDDVVVPSEDGGREWLPRGLRLAGEFVQEGVHGGLASFHVIFLWGVGACR